MNPFFILFSLITLISVVISGGLVLLRRQDERPLAQQEHIHSSVFEFFTTLYAFVIGFAIVTLWSAFLNAKTNVTREADSMMIVYRTAKHLPNSEPFRQAVANYVKTVIDVEWQAMEKDAMSPEANRRFEDIWSRYYELKCPTRTSPANFTPISPKPGGSAPPGAPCCKAISTRRSG